MKILLSAPFLALALFATPAFAGEGDVCVSKTTQAPNIEPLKPKTVFACASGNMTVAQMYKAGWRVVSIVPVAFMQPGQMTPFGYWAAVIEKN